MHYLVKGCSSVVACPEDRILSGNPLIISYVTSASAGVDGADSVVATWAKGGSTPILAAALLAS
jgi:hypothetical protein